MSQWCLHGISPADSGEPGSRCTGAMDNSGALESVAWEKRAALLGMQPACCSANCQEMDRSRVVQGGLLLYCIIRVVPPPAQVCLVFILSISSLVIYFIDASR